MDSIGHAIDFVNSWNWTVIAAVVTAVTLVVIAFQTIATAKAAKEAERSADAANKALRLGQAQQRQAIFMAIEAVKARIDAGMPVVTVTDAHATCLIRADGVEPESQAFLPSSDGGRRLTCRLDFRLHNGGSRAAEVEFSQPVRVTESSRNYNEGQTRCTLESGASVAVMALADRAVGEVVRRVETGEPEQFQVNVNYGSPTDEGGQDSQFVMGLINGIEKDQSNPDVNQWRIRPEAYGVAWGRPKRVYFLSRAANRRIPEVELSDLEPVETEASSS
ncbi:hypothetical protein ACFFGR_16820 [Arthrobacter liuii]|uniref:Uncharacterized protein n=1 Tax=Arthrobacter liuii TaxID=1476996 RepID=A0ABQ2AZD8_9MICC|nr:hypothetical protein [Arthrobacter liuii]GGI00980.1 hypothetical protein GCM10007170_39380 [Arthrobacter liuii]